MSNEVLVSAIIPTVGRPSVREAVASVLAQTVRVHPIVIVDRPEAELGVRSILADLHCDIIISSRVGGAGARNLGIESATTKYVAFLDDDDSWFPTKTETQLAALAAASDIATLSASSMVFVRQRDEIVVPERSPDPERSIADYLISRPKLRYGTNCVQSSSLLLSTRFALQVRWDAGLRKHQDWDFVIRALAVPESRLVWTDVPLVRVNQGSVGSVSRTTSWRSSSSFLRRHSHRMSSRPRADFIWSQILRSSFSSMDLRGIALGFRLVWCSRPHLAAVVVGLSGLLGSFRRAIHMCQRSFAHRCDS